MATAFKKETRQFRSYTGSFTDEPVKRQPVSEQLKTKAAESTRGILDTPPDQTSSSFSSNRGFSEQHHIGPEFKSSPGAGTQGDARLEQHTRGRSNAVDAARNAVIDERFIRYVGETKSHEPIDKLAERTSHTNAGDGADFQYRFDKNGKLKAKVQLAYGKDRTTSGTFTGKAKSSGRFVEYIHDKYELFKPTDEEEIDSSFETKAEAYFSQKERKAWRKKERFHSVRVGAKKDIKQLKKEIKAEDMKDEAAYRESYFNHSASAFSTDEEKFSSFTDKKFDKHTDREKADVFVKEKEAGARKGKKGKSSNPKSLVGKQEQTESGQSATFDEINRKTGVDGLPVQSTEEKIEQQKAGKKAAKKQENKQIRRAAAAASVKKLIETKKNLSSELMDDGSKLTGDLLADGNTGLTKTITSTAVNMAKMGVSKAVREIGSALWKLIAAFIGAIWPFVLAVMIIFLIFGGILAIIGSIGVNSDGGAVSYELDVGTSGTWSGTPLTPAEIQSIIDQLYATYPDMTLEQETTIRFALGCVGGAYDQGSHTNHSDNIWDCSELAYCSYLAAGIDISNAGYYTAAEECRAMVNGGYTVTGTFTLQPGDILFYGGSDNGRYLGVYHVAIYLGNFDGVDRMVEAYGTSRGVIMSDVRTNNLVNISRPAGP